MAAFHFWSEEEPYSPKDYPSLSNDKIDKMAQSDEPPTGRRSAA
jgi:hypothetical protein